MPSTTQKLSFDLSIHAEAGRDLVSFLRLHLPAARKLLRRSRLNELSIALVGDRRMGELHEQFMNIAGPTDVLTFPLESDSLGRATGGEIVLCVPEARRRAREHGVPVEQELLLYALHGMLHLSGFDDRTDADFHRMHRTEDRILTQLGIGPTFQPDGSRAGTGSTFAMTRTSRDARANTARRKGRARSC